MRPRQWLDLAPKGRDEESLPQAKTNKAMDPATGPATSAEGRARLRNDITERKMFGLTFLHRGQMCRRRPRGRAAYRVSTATICLATLRKSGPVMSGFGPSGYRTFPGL